MAWTVILSNIRNIDTPDSQISVTVTFQQGKAVTSRDYLIPASITDPLAVIKKFAGNDIKKFDSFQTNIETLKALVGQEITPDKAEDKG